MKFEGAMPKAPENKEEILQFELNMTDDEYLVHIITLSLGGSRDL